MKLFPRIRIQRHPPILDSLACRGKCEAGEDFFGYQHYRPFPPPPVMECLVGVIIKVSLGETSQGEKRPHGDCGVGPDVGDVVIEV